jgi:hypothetical protein
MSKGLGKVQRAILALCENEGGAWSTASLCDHVYHTPIEQWNRRAEKSAIGRAISRMKLPGTWVFERGGGEEWWLHDPCNRESVEKAFGNGEDNKSRIDRMVEAASRWRDASEVERLDIQIEQAEQGVRWADMFKNREWRHELQERVAALKRQKAELSSA